MSGGSTLEGQAVEGCITEYGKVAPLAYYEENALSEIVELKDRPSTVCPSRAARTNESRKS
jgi:hypothetical protein